MLKKIIDGLLYNTDTAELIYSWDNGEDFFGNDLSFRSKELYRTKKGNFFLFHFGGPMTDMAVGVNGGAEMRGSADIEPLDEEDVVDFLSTHEGVEHLQNLFPDRIEEA